MPRMIDLVRVSALPSNLMHAASRGSLKVPPQEMIEILVHLANKNQIFGQQARMTLAAWDEAASKAAAANPKTSQEVLDYFIAPENLRPALLPVLLENPSVHDGALFELISEGTKEVIEVMLKSTRIKRSARLTEELKKSPHLVERKIEKVEERPALPAQTVEETPVAAEVSEAYASTSVESSAGSEISDEDVNAYLQQHADELAAEGDKPFQPIGGVFDENTEMHQHEVEPEVKTESEAKPEPEAKPATEAKPEPRGLSVRRLRSCRVRMKDEAACCRKLPAWILKAVSN